MSWICSNCGTQVESTFKVCWNCGTDRDGNVDESFAIESDPLDFDDNPETPRVRCLECGYQGKVLFSTRDKTWSDWLWAAFVSLLISQRSWIHFCHKVCPKCGASHEHLTSWSGIPSADAEETWRLENEKESLASRKNRQLVYLIVGSLISASLILWFALR